MLLPATAVAAGHWATVIGFIIQTQFLESVSTCIMWHKHYQLDIQTESHENFIPIVSIWPHNLTTYFARDHYNFSATDEEFEERNFGDDILVKKLKVAIEHTHCESFIAFQDDIPIFASAFRNSSVFSLWRSVRNKFLFVYSKDLQPKDVDYFDDPLFLLQPNILVVEALSQQSATFALKTNKFVGHTRDHPEQLVLLNYFDALTNSLVYAAPTKLYPYKLHDVQGREVILGAFDYRPIVVVDYDLQPQFTDHAADNPTGRAFIDGTEARILLVFCEFHNCTVELETTQEDWGFVFPNNTGPGLLGMIAANRVHMGLGANYAWTSTYSMLDLTHYVGRSGVTCLVPLPQRLVAWDLPLKPFQLSMWLCFSACLVLEAIALVIARQTEENFHVEDENTKISWRHNFDFGISTTYRLFVSQSSMEEPTLEAVRIVLFACYTIDMIVTSVYGGGLSAVLTRPFLSEAADTLERLSSHNLLWTGSSTGWVEAILGIPEPMIKRVADNFRVHSFDELREMSKTENMGFVVERMAYGHFGNGEYVTEEALDHLKLMSDDIYAQTVVGAVSRNWAFLYAYNIFIMSWHECGFTKYWEWGVTARYLDIRLQNQIDLTMYGNGDTGPVKLDMKNFSGLVLLWLVGASLCVTAFFIELWWFKRQHRKALAEATHIEWS